MADILLVARLILAVVFAAAGVTKLADQRGSRQAVAGFGVPEILAPPVALLLPLLELAVAIALLPTRTSWPASLAAGALLVLFIVGMGINLLRGRTPDCHCFGQLHSEPIGAGTIARNAVLLAIAGFVGIEGRSNAGTSALTWLADLNTAERVGLGLAVAGFVLLLMEGWMLMHLLQQNGRLLVRLEALEVARPAPAPLSAEEPTLPVSGLPVGAPAPAFSLSGVYGETMTLQALQAGGNPTLLLFTSPGCGPCAALLPDVARWQREVRDRLTVALIATGSAEENRTKAVEHGVGNVLVQQQNEVADAYRSPGTPSAVLVGIDAIIARPMAVGSEQVRALVHEQLEGPQPEAMPMRPAATPDASMPSTMSNGHVAGATLLGDLAPDFNLPDVNGHQVRLGDLRGSDTLLLFWNTGCGFCQQMLDEFKAWEDIRPADSPRIVVFSSGPLTDIRALGLRSTVVPDPDFTYGPRLGANGTPMAVLLDAGGRVSSNVAAGAPAVMALARGQAPANPADLVPLQAQAPQRQGNGALPTSVRRGDPAPAIQLPDVDGRLVSLSDFRGRPILLLFWNTDCGFCEKMLPDLKTWEEGHMGGHGAPELLMISSGSEESIRAMGLRSTVVLDPAFSVGPAYGANGTPMAVLVDADGRIASDMAIGADAVLELANAVPTAAA